MKSGNLLRGVIVLVAAVGLQVSAPSFAADSLELKMQFASPDGTSWNDMDRRFASQIEGVTGGRAKVQFFPPNSVTPFKDWLQATGAGVLDLGFVWHPILQGKFPQMELFSLPGLAKNQTIATTVYWRLREQYPRMGKLFTEADNVIELATFVAMGSHLHSAKPIRSIADLKGKVLGAQDAAGVKVLEQLGASASVMVGSDAYLSLQRGAIDGVLAAWGWVKNFKLTEVTTYHSMLNLNPGTYSSVMNKDTFAKLSSKEQQHLLTITPMYFLNNTTDSAAAAMASIPPENILRFSPQDHATIFAATRPQWDAWVKKADGLGLAGREILDEAVRLMTLYDQN